MKPLKERISITIDGDLLENCVFRQNMMTVRYRNI